jgi:MurNAc alpha-1-phosphate uridylyltransferase
VSGIKRAMILAAGLGTRMAPYTAQRPKPLIELRGKPLIDYAIDRLAKAGVDFIVVNVHYKADQLIAHLDKRRAKDKSLEIQISNETDQILDTGGAVAKALPYFEGEPFFTHNSDSLWVEGMGSALARMNARWDSEAMDALMLLAPCSTAVGFEGRGDFEMDSLGLLKRRAEMNLAPFVWTGLQILHPRLFDSAPKGRFSINPLWDKAIDKSRLYGLRLDGVWIHVGTPQGLEEAESFLGDLAREP